MALTKEIIAANANLSGLTEEQINAITTLSVNDENDVIAKKTGEIYGKLDADILATSGVEKNGTEKTYDYAKRVIGDFATKAGEAEKLNGEIISLNREKAHLQKVIDEGGADKETAKQLKQAKADFENVTKQFNDLQAKYNAAESDHAKELFGIRVDNAIKAGTANLKFKEALPESATRVLLQQATDKVKAMNPEYIDDGQGGKVLVFKDATGAIMRNSNNMLQPYTAAELVEKELKAMDVLFDKQTGGGGTHANKDNHKSNTIVDISGARTRVEAYDIICASLMAQGMTAGSKAFDDAMRQAWADNNIKALPER